MPGIEISFENLQLAVTFVPRWVSIVCIPQLKDCWWLPLSVMTIWSNVHLVMCVNHGQTGTQFRSHTLDFSLLPQKRLVAVQVATIYTYTQTYTHTHTHTHTQFTCANEQKITYSENTSFQISSKKPCGKALRT